MLGFNSVDLFAGGGGASEGIRRATGVCPRIAVNHDPHAIQMHQRNHPNTLHVCESVFKVEPYRPGDRDLDLLWASPDCTHFSRARGGKPVKKEIRGLAEAILPWARRARPRVICLENVAEFITWGPLYPDDHPDETLRNRPIPERKGEFFHAFIEDLHEVGYHVEWRNLVAADFGAPTSRKRFFLIARRDGKAIHWPEPTHGPGREHPHRVAAEIIDWSIPCPSIFKRKRPLAEKTQRRIAEGLRRYVLEANQPFLVNLTHGVRLESLELPLKTVTCANRGEKALVAPTLIQTGYGERKGQRPRSLDLQKPLGTVVAGGSKHALVAAWLAKHNGKTTGQPFNEPLHTVTGRDTKALLAASLVKFYGTSHSAPMTLPLPTVTATGQHLGLVATFMERFTDWRGDAVTLDLEGEAYAIVDIGMRMLQPRELARAHDFQDDYILTGTKGQRVARIGNSVPPPVVEAIVRAQFHDDPRVQLAA